MFLGAFVYLSVCLCLQLLHKELIDLYEILCGQGQATGRGDTVLGRMMGLILDTTESLIFKDPIFNMFSTTGFLGGGYSRNNEQIFMNFLC